MARTSNIDIQVRVRGGRSAASQLRKTRKEAEALEIRGARALGAFASKADRFKDFGGRLSRNITLPLGLAGVASVKLAADFDDSMNKIVGLVGVGREQVNAWKKDVLSISQATGRGPEELADALFFITSAGLRGASAIDALTMSAKAADAGLGDTKVIADAVTSAMNSYGPEVLSAAQATDVLVATVRAGKVAAEDLAPVIGRVAPLADALGVSFDQVGGALAVQTRRTGDAAQAATSLSAIFSTFLKPIPKMRSALDEMGLSVDGVREMLAKRGLLETLVEITSRAKKAGIDLSEIFSNKRALNGVLQLTKNTKESADVLKDVANSAGVTDKAFEEAQKTFKDKWQDAVNSGRVTAIRFGAAVGPTLVPIIEKVGAAVGSSAEAFAGLSPTLRTVIVATVLFTAALGPASYAIGLVAGGAGRLLRFIVFLKKSFIAAKGSTLLLRLQLAALWVQQKLVAFWTNFVAGGMLKLRIQMAAMWAWAKVVAVATRLWAGAQWLLNIALTANPIGLVIAAIVALGAALVLAYYKIEPFRRVVNAVFTFVKNNWRWLVLPLAPIFGPIVLIISQFRRIKSVVSSVFGFVRSAANSFVGFWTGMPQRLSNAMSGLFRGIKDAFKSAVKWVIDQWNSLEFELPTMDLGPFGSIGGWTVGVPDITYPWLASGGYMTGYGSAVVGDAGPEVMTISPHGVAVEPLGAAPAGALAGGGERVVHEHRFFLDSREVTASVGHQVRKKKASQ